MANDFYNPTSNVPPSNERSNPDLYTGAEFRLIARGFDKLPALSRSVMNRQLIVAPDESGLALGAGYSVRWRAPYTLTEAQQVALTGVSLQASAYYRFYALIPLILSGTGNKGATVRVIFSQAPTYAAGFAVNNDSAFGNTEFISWATSGTTATFTALGAGASTGTPPRQVIEMHGIVATPANPVTVRIDLQRAGSVSGSQSVVVDAGLHMILMELVEV